MNQLTMNAHSISSNLVELLAVDCSDEEAVRELTVLVDPTVEWVKASHTPRSERQNLTGTGGGTGMYGNVVDNIKYTGAGSTTNKYNNNYNNNNSNSNGNNNSSNINRNNRDSYGKPSTTYGYNKTGSNAVSGAPTSSTAGGTSGLGDDSGLSLGEQKV